MSKEEDNKALVGRWFAEILGVKLASLAWSSELAAPGMLLRKYSLSCPAPWP